MKLQTSSKRVTQRVILLTKLANAIQHLITLSGRRWHSVNVTHYITIVINFCSAWNFAYFKLACSFIIAWGMSSKSLFLWGLARDGRAQQNLDRDDFFFLSSCDILGKSVSKLSDINLNIETHALLLNILIYFFSFPNWLEQNNCTGNTSLLLPCVILTFAKSSVWEIS